MSGPSVTGYAALAAGAQLEPFHYTSPELGEFDVRVDITHCGVCHSDIQAIDDYYAIDEYPFVPGHEIVGHVSAVSSETSGLMVGDRVAIGWLGRSCGQCEWCLRGEEQLCQDIVPAGTWKPYGGFATSVVVDSRFVYLLPPAMPSPDAAVLMCAGITVYNPLCKYLADTPQKIAILGVGGLGHLAIQFAHALGYEVTAISSSPDKEAQALAFGADYFIASYDRLSLRHLDDYFDLLLCTANAGIDMEVLFYPLKKRGRLILVGFPDVTFNSTELVVHELSIIGSFLGNRATMREMLAFAQAHAITPVVELMPMSQVNAAIQRVRDNQARYRIVLVNDLLAAQVE